MSSGLVLGYVLAMGIGRLARHRRKFMILGAILFLGGAVLRWHNERQHEALDRRVEQAGSLESAWHKDCRSYACRVVHARDAECDSVCDRSIAEGIPTVAAERIANACRKHCAAEGQTEAACALECLVSESVRSARGR